MRALAFSLLLIASVSAAQDADSLGTLVGVVTDAETGEPLIGANVWLPELQRGAAVGIDGHYEIAGVPEGTYRVVVSFAGLRADSSNVEIRGGQAFRLDVRLESDPDDCGIVLCNCWEWPLAARDAYTRHLIVYRNHTPKSCGCHCWTHERNALPTER